MKYLIVIEQTGTGHSGYAPDVPGCIATGTTRDEVEREMKAAIAFSSRRPQGRGHGDLVPDGPSANDFNQFGPGRNRRILTATEC